MITRDEFRSAFKYELVGRLAYGFAESLAINKISDGKSTFADAAKGKVYDEQVEQAVKMLDRMYDFMQPTVLPTKPVNGVPGPMMGVKR